MRCENFDQQHKNGDTLFGDRCAHQSDGVVFVAVVGVVHNHLHRTLNACIR